MGWQTESPDLRWFRAYPSCRCGSRSRLGELFGSHNQSYGVHCESCAKKRLKASERRRKKDESKENA